MKKYFVQKTDDGWVVKEDKNDTIIAAFYDSVVANAEKLARDLALKQNTAERRDNFDKCYNGLRNVFECTSDLYSGVRFLQSSIRDRDPMLDLSATCNSDVFMEEYLYKRFNRLLKAVEEMPARELMKDAFRFSKTV